MDDVAAAAGVSRALVSLVMRGSPRVSDRSRVAVRQAAERLGYRPNLAARNLASGRTSTFGVLLNDLHNPWFAEIADGIHDAADGAGYQIIIANGRRSAATEDRAVESFLSHRVDGMILAGCRLPSRRIDALGAKTAVVSVGRPLRSSHVDTVNTDERLGSELAVRHLADLGHRDIAHIDGGRGAGAAPRKAGYLAAMNAAGLGERCRVVAGDFTEEAGVHGVEVLLGAGRFPTAIYTANDLERDRRPRPARGRGDVGARRRLAGRVRQHCTRRPPPHRADDDRPAAGDDGRPRRPSTAGTVGAPHDRAPGGRPTVDRRAHDERPRPCVTA